MRQYSTPMGWQVFHGREWVTHRQITLALASAVEAVRYTHFNGKVEIKHEEWVLDCHYAEIFRYRTTQKTRRSRKSGTWHLYPPGLGWLQDTRGSTLPIRASWLRFHGVETLGLSRLTTNPTGMAVIHDPTGRLAELVHGMAIQGDDPSEAGYPDMLKNLMTVVKHLLGARQINTGEYVMADDSEVFKDPLIGKIDAFLVSHLHEPITLADISRHFHMSISSLHRHYDDKVRTTIRETLTRMRINKIKQLLAQGLSVAQTADQTGFCDQFHLSKTFRRVEGITPREYMSRLNRWRQQSA